MYAPAFTENAANFVLISGTAHIMPGNAIYMTAAAAAEGWSLIRVRLPAICFTSTTETNAPKTGSHRGADAGIRSAVISPMTAPERSDTVSGFLSTTGVR